MNSVVNLRKSLWHLRHGGIAQYREYKRRVRFGEATPENTGKHFCLRRIYGTSC